LIKYNLKFYINLFRLVIEQMLN